MMTEFYNKVIPPANRYLLHRYNTIPERARYSYSSMSQSFVVPEEKQVSMPVDQFLEEQMLFLCRKAQGSRAKEGPKPVSHSFLQNTAGKTPRFRQAYLAMFGDKNRNIANGCLEIMNAAHRVVKIHRMDRDGNFILNREQRGRELEPTVRHLLQSLLLSKEELQPYNEEVDSLLYCIDCENMIYVDYMRALRLYQEECRSIRMQERTKKAEEQSDEAARSTLRRKLAAVKQRVGTLMVMLFFIENILLLFDRERGRVHGYRELTEILNSDLILDERSSRMHVKLFRNYQSAEEFLDESPLVLDSPANYTGFQLFNLQYAREYLQDIMGTWRGGRLKFIVRQASLDSEWVRTILLMGFTMYSGITLVNSSFLLNQTLPEDCKVLDMFEFGGRLNQAIIREAKAFLRRPNLFLHSRSQLDELKNIFTGKHIKNILDKMPDEDTRNRIGEVLKPLLGGSFPNIPDNLSDEDARDRVGEALKYLLDHHQLCGSAVYSTSDRYKQIEEALMKDPGFIEQYVALRWNMSNLHWVSVDRVDETGIWQAEPCLMLIRFIETLMEECSRQLKNAWNWDLILTDKEANDLEELLGEIDDFNYEIMRQNELIRTEISAALKRTPVLRETETYYRVSTDGLIKYLSNVYTELFEGLSADDEYLFVKMSNRQIYFDVLHYICFYESERVSRNIWGIPLTSMLVMDVKMLAFLQPYYLAARFGIAVSRLYKSERALLDPGADHRGLTSNEKRLRRWYVILSKGAGGRLEELCELLEEVRADAADQYYWDLTEGRQ